MPNETGAPSSAQGAFDFSPAPAQPSQLPAEPGESGEIGGAASWYDYWPWALGIIAALVAAGWYWRSRRSAITSPPEIERPVVAKPSTSDTVTPPSIGGIALKLEAVSLSRSVMNLTLNYRLAITNQTLAMIERLGVSGDLITARGGVPLTQQVANSQSELPLLHEVARLSGKQTKDLSGKLTLPVAELALARQGEPLYVPLVRLRIEGYDGAPKVQTFVIGMLPTEVGGKLQPFRIDEQPQTYSQIGQRSID
ncbi:hypothetical protein [Altererythrobacter sp. MF3-039]|uniref:hypothetical protein n=1 Tax=Altererythrobacter sp. MF3-039 TaxID=3252901 RepID=UPI00390C418D